MDYEVTLITPSKLVAESARRVLQDLKMHYPVFAASGASALEIAERSISTGTRLIISHGMTYDFLRNRINTPMMRLPFTGLEAAAAIRAALDYSASFTPPERIVHVGTSGLYRYLQESIRFFGGNEALLDHFTLDSEKPVAEQLKAAILDPDYKIVIGGFVSTEYAAAHGRFGIEFDIDDSILEATIMNASILVKDMIRQEEKAEFTGAILQVNSDGIITTDENDLITMINNRAEQWSGSQDTSYIGKHIDQYFSNSNIIDISVSDATAKENQNKIPVIISTVPVLVQGISKGSVITLKRVSDIHDLEYQIRRDMITKGFVARYTLNDIIGTSSVMYQAKEKARIYANYDSTVLLEGETGCGKELFAQSIHNIGHRKHQPFVAVNCAALPENLIESELFGYVKGAFTGALREGKQGLFEIADHGTIFLDEISELPLAMQSKLLRVLQEGEIIRVGGDKVIKIDVRVICSSNQDLLKLVQEKKFKADLYYRLNILHIRVPPLRDRREDIPVLAAEFFSRYKKKYRKTIAAIDPLVIERLTRLPYIGNVRELRNIIERMVLLCKGNIIDISTYDQCEIVCDSPAEAQITTQPSLSDKIIPSRLDCESLIRALHKHNWNKTAVARELGVNPSTIWRNLKKYGITEP